MYSDDEGIVECLGILLHLIEKVGESLCRAIAVVLVGLYGHTVHLPAGGIVLQIVECALVVFLAEKYHHT